MFTNVARRAVFERYLTEAEEKQLFRHIAQFASVLARRDHAWMRLLRYTGMRVQSLSLFTVGDATAALTSNTLTVRPETAKGGFGYSAHLGSKAKAALQDLLRIRREMGFPAAPGEPLVMTQRGRGLSVRSYQARMREWVEDAGLQVGASPHWLRHTLAKRVMARSVAADRIGIVQVALGQRTRTSASVYTLPDRDEVARDIEAAQ